MPRMEWMPDLLQQFTARFMKIKFAWGTTVIALATIDVFAAKLAFRILHLQLHLQKDQGMPVTEMLDVLFLTPMIFD